MGYNCLKHVVTLKTSRYRYPLYSAKLRKDLTVCWKHTTYHVSYGKEKANLWERKYKKNSCSRNGISALPVCFHEHHHLPSPTEILYF